MNEALRSANIELTALREVQTLNETLRHQQRRMDALLEAHPSSERLSRLFQEAALLKALPTVHGLRFSALYEPAEAEAHVGGDFYDAFRLADGRVVVSIGDVVGSGIAAAATMSALRQSMRGAAWMNPDPISIFNAADDILEGQGLTEFATAFVGVIDPLTLSMQYAHAGHPPALLRSPDGRVRTLESGDVPLGLGFDEPSRHRIVRRRGLCSFSIPMA